MRGRGWSRSARTSFPRRAVVPSQRQLARLRPAAVDRDTPMQEKRIPPPTPKEARDLPTDEHTSRDAQHRCQRQIRLDDAPVGIASDAARGSHVVQIAEVVARLREPGVYSAQLRILPLRFDLPDLKLMHRSLKLPRRHAGDLGVARDQRCRPLHTNNSFPRAHGDNGGRAVPPRVHSHSTSMRRGNIPLPPPDSQAAMSDRNSAPRLPIHE